MTMRPDPTFHASPKLAMEAPAENFAYTLLLSPDFSQPDALAVIDVKPGSPTYGKVVHTVTMPNKGDEFHHFGWNACSSVAVAADRPRVPRAPLPHHPRACARRASTSSTRSRIRRRRRSTRSSSRRRCSARPATRGRTPSIAGRRASTSAPSAVAARTAPKARRASSSWTARHSRSRAAGRSTADRRSCITISGGTCRATTWCRANGRCRRSSRTASSPRTCLPTSTATACISGICAARRNVQTIDLGANHQMALEVRPAHDPVREYGFVGVVVDTTNLEGSIWTWWREGGKFHIEKTATIPAEPAPKDKLPPLLQGFGAVPPLVTDIDLSIDDRFLYVACWGTGEMRQYDVTRSAEAEAGRLRAHRRHRAAHAAPERQGLRRRPADGRDQPRRQARLLDQLALLDLG